MKSCTKYDVPCRIMRLITFVDLPIKKKFRLFSFGVLFWFLVMATLTVVGMAGINVRYDKIVNHVVPQDKVVKMVIRNLQAMNIDSYNMLKAQDRGSVARLQDLSSKRLRDIRDFSAALALGGEVNDYSHDSGKLLETLNTTSLTGNERGVSYLKELNAMLDEIDISFGEFFLYKIQVLDGEAANGSNLEERFEALEQHLHQASQLSIDFSSNLSELYYTSSNKISEIIEVTILTIIVVFLVAVLLLGLFTRWIVQSLARPIKAIIDQIHDVGTGDVDLTKKIEITSRDEIGTLSQEFNNLMDTVYSMSMFKKVIEEDATLEDVYARIGEVFHRELDIEDFVIYEINDNQRDMLPVYPLALKNSELFCSSEILTDCNLCRAKKTGHEVSALAYPQVCKQFKEETARVHICLPMIIGGRTGGVIQFLFERGENALLPADIQARIFKAETYIKQALSVLEAKRLMHTLRESALKDPLTGLYNRRFLQDHANHVISGVLRRKKTLGLLMCDLDYFKQVNDQYGHDVGDQVLQETATLIIKGVRDSDIVIRFGGEEFFILLVDINPGESVVVAEKIRKVFDESKIKVPNGSITKTLSLGVSEFPGDGEGFWQCIKYADVALYKAKETGRNKVVRFEESMWSGSEF
ncbi:MAG: diguanylate cyclase [Desulfuromonadales bacterium]|nr:diguanylate cyclase [Desulfuromonadales bacterium]